MVTTRIRQEEEEEATRRRRHVAPPPPPPPAEALFIAPYAPSRHRHGEHLCICPECGWETSVEEGQKCNQLYCENCGDKMRAVETGEYRISGESPSMGAAIIGLIALTGMLLWAASRKV